MQEQRRERGADQLDDDVAGHATPREIAAKREGNADGGIQVGAGHFAHKQDDRHHHQPGRDNRRATADGIGKCLPHHPAASGDEDEEKRPQQLGEQPAPLLLRIGEVRERVDQRLLVRLERMLASDTHQDDFYLSVGACDSMNDWAEFA